MKPNPTLKGWDSFNDWSKRWWGEAIRDLVATQHHKLVSLLSWERNLRNNHTDTFPLFPFKEGAD